MYYTIYVLQILEGGALRPTLLAEVSLPLPESSVTLESLQSSSSSPPFPLPFSSDHRSRPDAGSAALGSGVDFSASPDGSEVRSELTRGRVFCRVGWGRTSDGVVLSPPQGQWRPPPHPMHHQMKQQQQMKQGLMGG